MPCSSNPPTLSHPCAPPTCLPDHRRFEPCGLVDIEFGWEGALCIGHNTGGLGKMPGVYFDVQSSAVSGRAAESHQLSRL